MVEKISVLLKVVSGDPICLHLHHLGEKKNTVKTEQMVATRSSK